MRVLFSCLIIGSLLSGCGSSGSDRNSIHSVQLSGKVQKGPFASDAVGEVTGLGNDLRAQGRSLATALTDIDRYSIRLNNSADYFEVEFTGTFFDELTAAPSSSPVTLRVIVPASVLIRGEPVNVNLLTTLIAARMRTLVASTPAPANPVAAAENEFLQLFPFSAAAGLPLGFHQLDETGAGVGDGFDLLVSLIVLRASHDLGLSLAALLELLEADFADNGRIDDVSLVNALAQATNSLDIAQASAALRSFYAAAGRTVTTAPAQTLINRAPVADAGVDQRVIVGSIVTLSADASVDRDGDSLSYEWTVLREQSDFPYYYEPPYQTFTLQGASAQFVADQTASYLVTLKVTDPSGASAGDIMRIVAHHDFVANGDGTVTNVQTGLIWQQQPDATLHTLAEGDGRSRIPAPSENPDGLNVCGDLVLAGNDDWRVPLLPEVRSLIDFSLPAPKIDLSIFPGTLEDVPHISNSWRPNVFADYVYFSDGLIQHVSVGERGMLRCVRP